MAQDDIEVRIRVNADEAIRDVGRFGAAKDKALAPDGAKRAAAGFAEAERAAGSLGRSGTAAFGSLARSAVAAAAAIVSIGAAMEVVRASVSAATELGDAQRFLATQSRLSGVALDESAAAAERLRESFGLSRAEASRLQAQALAFGRSANDIGRVDEFVQALGDSAVASGRKLSELPELLNQLAAGSDEATEKLFAGRQPSQIYDAWAKSLGTTADKLDAVQKKQALFNEVLVQGERVAGSASDRLNSTAGGLDRFNALLTDLAANFGTAILESKDFAAVLQTLTELVRDGSEQNVQFRESVAAIAPVFRVTFEVIIGLTLAAAAAFEQARRAYHAWVTGVGIIVVRMRDGEQAAKFFREEMKRVDEEARGAFNSVAATGLNAIDSLERAAASAGRLSGELHKLGPDEWKTKPGGAAGGGPSEAEAKRMAAAQEQFAEALRRTRLEVDRLARSDDFFGQLDQIAADTAEATREMNKLARAAGRPEQRSYLELQLLDVTRRRLATEKETERLKKLEADHAEKELRILERHNEKLWEQRDIRVQMQRDFDAAAAAESLRLADRRGQGSRRDMTTDFDIGEASRKQAEELELVGNTFGWVASTAAGYKAQLDAIAKIEAGDLSGGVVSGLQAIAHETLFSAQAFMSLGAAIGSTLANVITGTDTFANGMLKMFLQIVGQIATMWGTLCILVGTGMMAIPGFQLHGGAAIAAGIALTAFGALMTGLAGAIGGGGRESAAAGAPAPAAAPTGGATGGSRVSRRDFNTSGAGPGIGGTGNWNAPWGGSGFSLGSLAAAKTMKIQIDIKGMDERELERRGVVTIETSRGVHRRPLSRNLGIEV